MHLALSGGPACIESSGDAQDDGADCHECGFRLWVPLGRLRVSQVGLYDDRRFPGRSLLVLDHHEEDLSALEGQLLTDYMADLRDLSAAIKAVTGAPRINVAVLGNAVPHLHWHVIPRQPDREPLPNRSPWDDPRKRLPMPTSQLRALRAGIGGALNHRSVDSDGLAPVNGCDESQRVVVR